jgi:surfeit locus 1 family protein
MPNPAPILTAPGLRRFRPRLLPTLATLAAVILFVAAGNWQRGRMQGKEALRAAIDVAAQSPPVNLAALPAATDWSSLRFRPVTAAGEFDAAHQILIDNRIHAGRAGYDVVTPLKLADGRFVLVARGWIAQGASRRVLPDVAPASGAVTVSGRLALPSTAYLELKKSPPDGPLWQNLDLARFAEASGLTVLPMVIEQTLDTADGLLRDWPAPDFGTEKHWMYMWQWYAFATLAVALWLGLNWRRSGVAAHD